MPFFDKFIQPISEKELKGYRNRYKTSLKDAKKFDKLNPPKSPGQSQYSCHLYNTATDTPFMRDEELLDHVASEGKIYRDNHMDFDYHVKFCRACIRITQHRFEEALQMFLELEAEGKKSHYAHILHYLIDIYNHLEDYKSAAKWVHAYFAHWVIDHKSSYAMYAGLNYMLVILAKADEFENVIKYGLERINMKFRGEQYVHFLVAQSYLNLRDLQNGLKYYDYIFKRKVPYPDAYVNLGEYYRLVMGDNDTALEYLIKAVKSCGTDRDYKKLLVDLYHNFSFILRQMNDPEKATKYRRALYAAMGEPILLSDLTTLFIKDRGSMEEYRAWLSEVA